MMLGDIGLFKGIMAKMDWLDQNQRIIAQNVANADTPGYSPMMLKEKDFASLLGASNRGSLNTLKMTPVALEATDSKHFGLMAGGNEAGGSGGQAKEVRQKGTYEASPDNNAVILEEQLFNANRNSINYQVATDLYRRNVGMLRSVIQGGR